MSKRTRQFIGILFAIVAYYIVHEGAHLIVALAFHAFKRINFLGLGIQVDIYRDRLTDIQLGVFCIAGVTATLITAGILVCFKEKICAIENKLVKAVFYYITVAMLVLDPIYLCLLSGLFGGGDLNGILYLMPQDGVWTLFVFILIFNIWILLKKVNPVYSAAFKEMLDKTNIYDTSLCRLLKNNEKHLPLYGVGPVIVFGQFIITGLAIFLSYIFNWNCMEYKILNIPLKVIGVLFIIFGFYLDYAAKHTAKLFEKVSENILIEDGIYSWVRNPVYSGAFFMCLGAICITNRLPLFAVSIICWGYMSLLLVVTEEKWLRDLYGKQYEEYCKKVNRCIPWFRKK